MTTVTSRRSARTVTVGLLAAIALLGACSSDTATTVLPSATNPAPTASTAPPSSEPPATEATTTAPTTTTEPDRPVPVDIASVERTFVDTTRPTAATASAPASESRTLVTTVFYPSASEGSPDPDRDGGPWPLFVFAHGTGANPEMYRPLLEHVARAGYVVAAPAFPLTSSFTPGGPNVGDVSNQPADLSFVIDSLIALTAHAGDETLAAMIDPDAIAVGGHSLGGISTLALVANSCCRDTRVDAAVVMAGTDQPMPDGAYDVADAPPMLFISGTSDSLVPYNQTVRIFNDTPGPKAMVTIIDGDHGSSAGMSGTTAETVYDATVDFLDAVLRGDRTRLDDLASRGGDGVQVAVAPEDGSAVTVDTLPEVERNLQATIHPTEGLRDGDEVTIEWSGFTPGQAVSILQCGPEDADFAHPDACDFERAKLLLPNPTGSGTTTLTITAGAVGTSTCDAAHPGCFIMLNNASSTAAEDMLLVPISFAD